MVGAEHATGGRHLDVATGEGHADAAEILGDWRGRAEVVIAPHGSERSGGPPTRGRLRLHGCLDLVVEAWSIGDADGHGIREGTHDGYHRHPTTDETGRPGGSRAGARRGALGGARLRGGAGAAGRVDDRTAPTTDGDQWDREERAALRRVPGLSTELEDVTEVEYRQLRLENVVLVGVYPQGAQDDAENSLRELAALAETAGRRRARRRAAASAAPRPGDLPRPRQGRRSCATSSPRSAPTP